MFHFFLEVAYKGVVIHQFVGAEAVEFVEGHFEFVGVASNQFSEGGFAHLFYAEESHVSANGVNDVLFFAGGEF